MYQHLFAIVDRLPASWRPPEWALGLVHVRSVNGLDVLAGACERVPAANARTLAQHHEVVAAAMDAARRPEHASPSALPPGAVVG